MMHNTLPKLLAFLLIILSFPLFSQVSSTDSLNRARADLADSLAHRYKSRTFKFDSALFYAKRAVALRRKLPDRAALVKSLIGMGDVYHARKKYKEAVGLYKEGVRFARNPRNLILEKKVYDQLIRTSKSADNYKEAFYYQGLIAAIDDSTLNAINEEKSREIIALKKELEEIRVQNENKVLKQQAEISGLVSQEQELQLLNEKYLKIAAISASVVALIFLALLYRAYRLKRKLRHERTSHENENQERLAISKDIGEDLGLELSRIHFLSQEVIYKPAANEVKKNASTIAEISNSLMDSARDMVWQLNTENTTLVNLIGRLREFSTAYMQEASLEVIFRKPDTLPNIPLKRVAYRNIFMAVKETLDNIAKHARALNVDISVSLKGDYLNITVKDDGVIGYDRAPETLGVKNMKTRIQSIGGLLNVVGEEQGTSVRMDIRISQIRY